MGSDRAVKDLAALLAAIRVASEDPAALEQLLDTLTSIVPVVAGAALFGGYGGGAFVATSSRVMSGAEARAWLRWPLRRLFIRMRPTRIFDPAGSSHQALAIPFAHGSRRWVALATLRKLEPLSPYDDVIEALESITVPAAGFATAALAAADGPLDPAIVSFALPGAIHQRLLAAVSTRGWASELVTSFSALVSRLKASAPDIVAVDVESLRDPIAAITTIHRIADYGALRILAFKSGDSDFPHSSAVIDCFLPHDAGEELIFKAIKQLANDSARLRKNVVREESVFSQRLSEGALTFQEITNLAAAKAAEIMRGWAACFLLNGGTIYRAESAPASQPVFRAVPNTFLSGLSAFQAIYRPNFLDNLTDDPSEQLAFEAMRPLSAATLTFVSETGRHLGVLVAASTERHADSGSLEALQALAAVVVKKFGRLVESSHKIPELQKDRGWERLRAGTLRLEVYRSTDCAMPWRYRFFTDTDCLLTLNIEEDRHMMSRLCHGRLDGASLAKIVLDRRETLPFFVGSIDLAAEMMSFAALGFSAPVVLDRPGPAGVISTSRGVATGTAALNAASNAIVCDSGLSNWLRRRAQAAESVQSLLDREAPAGLASIIALG